MDEIKCHNKATYFSLITLSVMLVHCGGDDKVTNNNTTPAAFSLNQVGSISLPNCQDVVVQDTIAYVADEVSRLAVVDVSDGLVSSFMVCSFSLSSSFNPSISF